MHTSEHQAIATGPPPGAGWPTISPGATLGRFTIVEMLGQGGMGVVYRAHDPLLGRTVAIKLLRPEAVVDPDRKRRFLLEARAVSALNHPNVVTIHDLGEDPLSGTWIAMECLEGESLQQRLRRGRLDVREALRVAIGMARGLAAAHAAGVVHRDVKPANVMIESTGQVKVFDFGLAKLVPAVQPLVDPLAATQSLAGGTSFGVLLGTPAYMSPEQALGRPVDARCDVFSFGATLYEMLAGRRPFEGANELALASSDPQRAPPSLRRLCPEVPPSLERLVTGCLAADPSTRPASAKELVTQLEACLAAEEAPARRRLAPRTIALAGISLVLAAIAVLGLWAWRRWALERQARQALPEIQWLVDADDLMGAFRLAETVRPALSGDPTFDRLWLDLVLTSRTSVRSEPAGAEVFVKPYADPDAEWRLLGRTPVENFVWPRIYSRFRISKSGYEPVELAFAPSGISAHPPFQLAPKDRAVPGMVLVPATRFSFRGMPEVDLPRFWLDRYEVSNAQFESFVTGGGYRRRELWKHPFVHRGSILSFDDAMALFRDRTGRPGPSTWELGSFAEGRADYPVSGISWYEAAAYAEFVGKSLPTLHHWYRAADLSRFSDILRFSNFDGEGPRPVGQQPNLTSFGNYDMAGNVREWVWNADGNRRHTLGGAWSDPTYLYAGPDVLDPMERNPILGVRCALYEAPLPQTALAEVKDVARDISQIRPVADEVFRIFSRFFDYDPAGLDAKVERVDDGPRHWRAEKVSFTAAYRGERVPAWLYLPRTAAPPFQTVVYFPPASANLLPSIDEVGSREFAFLVRSGRAVLFPAYQQTYERRRKIAHGPNYARQVITERALDVRRALDFLESRPEVDQGRIALYGLSMGADMGTILGAVEPRLRALVLVAGGLDFGVPPEVDGVNFAPHVRCPVLMVNGRYDFLAPFETSQVPLFRLLGTSAADKKHVVFDSGHVPPWPDVVRETLDWLDLHLGTVTTAPPPRP